MNRIVLSVILALLFLGGAFFGLYGVSFAVDGVTPGVYVGPVELGGLSRDRAAAELDELARRIEATRVLITYGDNQQRTTAGELGVSMDVPATLDEACRVGNTGSIINRLTQRQRVKHHGLHLEPVLVVDRGRLEQTVAANWGTIEAEPENAGFKVLPDDSVVIVPGRMGKRIDFPALAGDINRQLAAVESEEIRAELPVLAVAPRRTTEDIVSMGISGLVAKYSTRFDAGQVGRTYNIKVAASALDGLLIAPGEEFSFNRVVGPRSSEAGYKNANVIINNELVEGLGGGVCQVSSTLYNAVLLADLQVTERSNHSLPVGYVPVGRDATVVYGALDFRFVNNKDYYIYIRSAVEGNTLTIKLYGNKDRTPPVEISSWITETIEPTVKYEKDPNLANGEKVVKQEGKPGYKASAVRYVWRDGEKITEQLPGSYYKPVPRIIALGTGEASPSVVVPLDDHLDPVIPDPAPAAPDPDAAPADPEEDGMGNEAEPDAETPAETGEQDDGTAETTEPGEEENARASREEEPGTEPDAGGENPAGETGSDNEEDQSGNAEDTVDEV